MHVAITGASSGIGEALAREYGRAGAAVTLVARRQAELERIAAEIGQHNGGRCHVVSRDLSDPGRAADWIAAAEAALGPIDVLVSNAGFLTLGAVADFDPDEADRMAAINYLTPVRLIRTVLPAMLARRQGTIVNVTSMASVVTMRGWAYQAASKTASATFSEALHTEVAGTGVHVMTVYPGPTDTPMTQGGLEAYGRQGLAAIIPLGSAGELAGRIRRGVERRSTRLFYPRFYRIARWFPKISQWVVNQLGPALPPPPAPRQLPPA